MRLLLPLVLLCASIFAALPARADEVFVLDNGYTVRGFVVREDKERVVVRLAGFAEENRITLRPSEIHRRYKNVPAKHLRPIPKDDEPEPDTGGVLDTTPGQPRTIHYGALTETTAAGDAPTADAPTADTPTADTPTAKLPELDPSLRSEAYLTRLTRVTGLALPTSLEWRLLLGALVLTVLAVIVAGGTRVLGMKAASMHASTTLGLVLGVFLLADVYLSGEMLRADRALWIVPLQAAIWLIVAGTALDAPLSRTIPLLAMVLFTTTVFVFATGSLLVSV